MANQDRYEVIQEIGRGAMGIVYKAIDRDTSATVALKALKSDLLKDEHILQRFKNEVILARKITHKNVCRIYDFTRYSGGPCISMEYVEGETLRSLLNRIGVFSLKSAMEIARQICGGLREAHAQGVVHRDLKPENLMMDRNGGIKIMDFGVARAFEGSAATTMGVFAGTPAYMAPEQVECKEVDQRADIYAFGLILYEIITGREVFRGDTPLAVAYKQVHEIPPAPRSVDPAIPENVQNLIIRCLEKDPGRRFQTVAEIESVFADSGYKASTAIPVSRPVDASKDQRTTFIMSRSRARSLMLAVQALYLALYGAVLYHAERVTAIMEALFGVPAVAGLSASVILALCGIAARIYLISALTFDHPELPQKFRRLFPVLFVLDAIWAASPLLLLPKLRFGITLACVAVLAYVPFSQRTLMENLSLANPRYKR
jgi:serine/threonine protein kinase